MTPEELKLVLDRLADIEKRMNAEELKMSRHKHLGQTEGTQVLSAARTSVYAGTVNANGTAVSLPTGWSSTKLSTGDYQITHNLGTTAYAVVGFIWTAAQRTIFDAGSRSTTTFELYTKDTTPTFQDTKFDFILVLL